jgi:hypothetical protein
MALGLRAVKSIVGDREGTGPLIQSKALASSVAKPYLILDGPKGP